LDTGLLSKYHVRFVGPPLIRRSRGALSAAAITLVERRPAETWGNQIQEYVVLVGARDRDDAVSRVRTVIEGDGYYKGFAPVIASS
jgi:hypothetical protein